jgi:nitrate reductase NapA
MQQEGWKNPPYENFRHPDGKARFKLCEQDYGPGNKYIKEVTDEFSKYGARKGEGPFLYKNQGLLKRARDLALVPELPDIDFYDDAKKTLADAVKEDKYPFWLGLGIVYEHFHTSKTIRGTTTLKLVPEQYVELSANDAKRFGLEDGERVRVVTRRSNYEARVSVGTSSIVRPARSEVPDGYLFSPWNLSVADSADPTKNRWLVNAVSHRAWDPVSGQADYKKLAARIERI